MLDTINFYMKALADVAASVFGNDFMYDIGYSEEHEAIVFTVANPRIEDSESGSITAAIPAKPDSMMGARYISVKMAAQLYTREHEQNKPKLEVVKSKLIVPGQ